MSDYWKDVYDKSWKEFTRYGKHHFTFKGLLPHEGIIFDSSGTLDGTNGVFVYMGPYTHMLAERMNDTTALVKLLQSKDSSRKFVYEFGLVNLSTIDGSTFMYQTVKHRGDVLFNAKVDTISKEAYNIFIKMLHETYLWRNK